MTDSRRRAASLVVLIAAAAASLATSQVPPGQYADAADLVTLAAGEDEVVRQVDMTLVTGSAALRTSAELGIDIEFDGGAGAVSVSVVRDSDGRVLSEERTSWGSDDDAPAFELWGGDFSPFGTCPADTTCADTFTVTFARTAHTPEDLEFEWTVWVRADPGTADPGPPEGSSLEVEIRP